MLQRLAPGSHGRSGRRDAPARAPALRFRKAPWQKLPSAQTCSFPCRGHAGSPPFPHTHTQPARNAVSYFLRARTKESVGLFGEAWKHPTRVPAPPGLAVPLPRSSPRPDAGVAVASQVQIFSPFLFEEGRLSPFKIFQASLSLYPHGGSSFLLGLLATSHQLIVSSSHSMFKEHYLMLSLRIFIQALSALLGEKKSSHTKNIKLTRN
ncbi:uncharacterized protein LOC131183883 [Ahaetulla prasina]|uniref:uncharacterized protein LOC131183883 n=1 Tax=Ahaetulla prasina TaxID=499056 RepID=UPI002648AA3F|nr:uncharacterized protein LOC131183883 [Ahaetulla prasina]